MFNVKNKNVRMIALDIETTGMNKSGLICLGHRIIEIAAVEIVNRKLTGNNFHIYINPKIKVNTEAFDIHGISNDFLSDKPLFIDIYRNFIEYIKKSDIIVHNANFDITFLDYEINKINKKIKISETNKIIDTLEIARSIFPGKKNNLNVLCDRYNINISHRNLHSALVDAKLLSELYLRMTSIQKKINFSNPLLKKKYYNIYDFNKQSSPLLQASKKEEIVHLKYLKKMEKKNFCLWTTRK